jgi:diacylglycerol O-acyltransferase
MRNHIQRRTLPAGVDRDALTKLISELHSERLDRSRPMWIAYLIDGLEDARFALYLKVHHTVVDGVAGLNMIADAMTTDPDRRSMPPLYAAAPGQPVERAAAARGLIPNPFALVRSAVNATTASVGFVRQLALGGISTVVASLAERNTVLPFGAPYTRFTGPKPVSIRIASAGIQPTAENWRAAARTEAPSVSRSPSRNTRAGDRSSRTGLRP